MAPVYADHPFKFIPDPRRQLKEGEEHDQFETVAGEMAWIHNCFLRGLNAVYLQAPHVQAADAVAFANFALQWSVILHHHHTNEETDFFPGIEAMAGEKGIMAVNVQQHEAFHDGVEAYTAYLEGCAAGRTPFDGARLVAIIDSFGPTLAQHLAEEVDTLLGLRRFGHERFKDLVALSARMGEQAVKHAGLATGVMFTFLTMDKNFEDGRWAHYPPVPKLVVLLVRYVFYYFHPSWWKFAPCDRYLNLQPLAGVPDS